MRKTLLYLILLTSFIPLLVSGYFFFPYVFFKAIIFRLVVLSASSILIYFLIKNKLYKLHKDWSIIFLFLFLLILPLASIFSADMGDSIWGGFERMEGALYYVLLALFLFLLLQTINSDKNWYKLFFSIIISNLFIDILAIFQKIGLDFWLIKYGGRIGGTLGNAAYLASVLLVGLIFLIFFFYKYKKWRWLSGITIFCNMLVIFISATRGALLALIFSFFLALIFALFKKNLLEKKQKIILLSCLLFLIFFVSSIFIFKESAFVQNTEPLYRLSAISLQDATSISRLKIWQYSWNGFLDKPIFGWGLENFDLVFNKYFDGQITENWFDRAHNNYLDILLAGGAVSLLCYLIFIFFIFKNIYNLYRDKKIDFIIWEIFTFGWLAYLVQNIFIFDTINSVIFILFFVVLLYYLRYGEQNLIYFHFSKISKYFIFFLAIIICAFLLFFAIIKPYQINRYFITALKTDDSNIFRQLVDQALEDPYFTLFNEEILIFSSDYVRADIKNNDESSTAWIIEKMENFQSKDIQIYLNLSYFYLHQYMFNKDDALIHKNVDNLLTLLKNNQNRYLLFDQLGESYIYLADQKEAEKYFKLSYDLRPDANRIWNLMLLYVYFDDQYTLRYYTNIFLDQNVSFFQFPIDKLLTYFQKIEDYESLDKVLSRLHEEQPKNAQVLFNLTITKFKLGQLNEAASYAQKAIDIDPSMEDKLEKIFGI